MRTNTFETYNLLTGYIELPDVKLRVVGSEFAVRKINFLSDIYIFWRRIEHRVLIGEVRYHVKYSSWKATK